MTTETHQGHPPSPYCDLYIYYLKGHLLPATPMPEKDYIGDWKEDGFSFLFFSHPARHAVEKLVASQTGITLIDDYHMTYEQWHGGVFQPCRIGGFTITPPWSLNKSVRPHHSTGHVITLDPGVVFGTGLHPTTQDCLYALETLFKIDSIRSIVDLGTGTGLLALAAARLGGVTTLAVDNNLLAAKTAKYNVDLNNLQDRVLVAQGAAEDGPVTPVDLLVANVHFDVVQKIVQNDEFHSHKYFILSGLMRSQAKELLSFLAPRPVDILSHWSQNEIWHTYLGKNR
jgi:ribosomal protein L11 methyltransferase